MRCKRTCHGGVWASQWQSAAERTILAPDIKSPSHLGASAKAPPELHQRQHNNTQAPYAGAASEQFVIPPVPLKLRHALVHTEIRNLSAAFFDFRFRNSKFSRGYWPLR